jgi:hypothetical protein
MSIPARICAIALAVLASCSEHGKADSREVPPQANGKKGSALVFDPVARELGRVPWPEGVDTKFSFKNPSTRDIRIIDLLASCGCTNARMRILRHGALVREGYARGETIGPLLVVHPGEEGELAVRFESRTLSGAAKDHHSMITIVTDENGSTTTQVFIKAELERKYELDMTTLAFDPMGAKQSVTREAKLYLLSPGAVPPFDAKVVSAPPWATVRLSEALQGLRPYVAIAATAGPGLARQINQGEIVISGKFARPTSDETMKINIPIIVPVVADVQVKPGYFDFQVLEPGKPALSKPVFAELLDPDAKFAFGTASISGDNADLLKLTIMPTDQPRRFELQLECEKGFPRALPAGANGMVTLPTGVAALPELRLQYRALFRTPPAK